MKIRILHMAQNVTIDWFAYSKDLSEHTRN